MILTIAKKEFFEKILDARVTISFLIAIVLSIVATIVVGEDYQVKKKAYDQVVAQAQAKLKEVKVFSEYQPEVVFPPSPLRLFSKGIDLATPMTVNIRPDWVPRYEPTEAESNPLMRFFEALDIATVLLVLFALLVILLTYDAFSGERENGTLRHVMSNPVLRVKLLYGKILGTLIVVAVGVVLTFAVALILIQTFYGVALSSEDYARAGLILVTAWLYLVIFAVLGIWASIKFCSSTSLTVLLFVWFVAGLLHPDLNTFVISELGRAPRFADVQPAIEEANRSYIPGLETLQTQYSVVLNDKSKHKFFEASKPLGNVPLYLVVADADYEILEYLIKQTQSYHNVVEAADKGWKLYQGLYLEKLEAQLRWKRLLDLSSPAALFKHAVAVLSRTDIDNTEAFLEQARQYRIQYLAYLDRKNVFSNNAYLFFSRLRRDQIDPVDTARRLAQYAKDPSLIPWTRNQPPLDLADAPAFTAQASPLGHDLVRGTRGFLPLLVYFVLLLVGATASLKTYDVR